MTPPDPEEEDGWDPGIAREDDDYDDDEFWCDECQGTGYVECLCGGDLCICTNNGDEPCPSCS